MSNLVTGGQNTSNVTLNENGYQVKLRPEIKELTDNTSNTKILTGSF